MPTTDLPVVQLARVSRTYRRGREEVKALRDVDLLVEQGEILVVVGPSGCGKSTLVHVTAGLERPTSGAVLLESIALADLDDDARAQYRRRRVGIVFQFHNLIPTLSVSENVAFPLLLDGKNPAESFGAALTLLSRLGMGDLAESMPSELSGGEQQRVAIARAFVARPAIVVADEPTGSLDSANREVVHDLLVTACRSEGVAAIVVTHDPRTSAIGDRVVRMEDGRISGAPSSISTSSQ